MKRIGTVLSHTLVTVLSLALFAGVAYAAYPDKTIQVFAPANPGGDTDANARLFNKYLEKELGATTVVVNMGGGGGIPAMQRVKAAKPDGYTAMFFHVEALIPKIGGFIDFDILDFALCGIALVDDTTVVVVNKDAPYDNMQELVAAAQAQPGEVEFAMLTAGYAHAIGIALLDVTKAPFKLVDVGANAAKIVALKGKKTDVITVQYNLIKDYLKVGDFKSLGLLSDKRNPLIPDVPTTMEQGYPLIFNKFFFYAMPAGTPQEIIDTFSAAMKRVTENPEFQAEANRMLLSPYYLPPVEAADYVKNVREYLLKYQDGLRPQK
jgi:tripartite-type tricarboxylate transporter receptor subunit TctC